ncbi:radical SAM protein [bacterium]|jgi:radical SAM protein with 4Fe4S-binding SPASM domain|nr:radical SAM protein [bacterium]
MKFKDNFFKHSNVVHSIEEGNIESMLPIHIRIEPTEACNLSCKFCIWHSPSRRIEIEDSVDLKSRVMSKDDMYKLMKSIVELKIQAVSFTGSGDPLVNKYTPSMINYLVSYGVKVGITSNFSMDIKDEDIEKISQATWIRWSQNSSSVVSFDLIHRPKSKTSNYNNAKSNILKIMSSRKARGVFGGINSSFVVHSENEKYIVDAARDASRIKLSEIIFRPDVKLIKDEETSDEYSDFAIEELKKANKLFENIINVDTGLDRVDEGVHTLDKNLKCYYAYGSFYIAANGDIYPCCYTRIDKRYVYGNFFTDGGLLDIINNKREKFLDKLKVHNCPSCPYVGTNTIVKNLIGGDTNDLNSTNNSEDYVFL